MLYDIIRHQNKKRGRGGSRTPITETRTRHTTAILRALGYQFSFNRSFIEANCILAVCEPRQIILKNRRIQTKELFLKDTIE
jgi:hypothetical protein